jgi:CheY-like chemotaxis protein
MGGDRAILIVDDDATISEAARVVLESEGYHVACAANGNEALDYLRRNPPPALILLDLMMVGGSGWEFRAAQQQDSALAAIPVIVFSAAGDVGKEAKALGAIDYVTKPVEFPTLVEVVRRHC